MASTKKSAQQASLIWQPSLSLNSNVSTSSEYFAIVADQIYIEGNGQLNISQASDFEAAGLPALPTSGSGVAKVSLK